VHSNSVYPATQLDDLVKVSMETPGRIGKIVKRLLKALSKAAMQENPTQLVQNGRMRMTWCFAMNSERMQLCRRPYTAGSERTDADDSERMQLRRRPYTGGLEGLTEGYAGEPYIAERMRVDDLCPSRRLYMCLFMTICRNL
jgi:hypothetical protein